MPLYTYENKHQDIHCTYCLGGFDVMQKLTDPVLTHCSYCGCDIKKIISAPHVTTGTTGSPKSTLSEKNITKNGFSQYRKVGQGKYEKTAGQGPDQFSTED
jgi:predicted nucleic acid-binding Zn ribbon protein